MVFLFLAHNCESSGTKWSPARFLTSRTKRAHLRSCHRNVLNRTQGSVLGMGSLDKAES